MATNYKLTGSIAPQNAMIPVNGNLVSVMELLPKVGDVILLNEPKLIAGSSSNGFDFLIHGSDAKGKSIEYKIIIPAEILSPIRPSEGTAINPSTPGSDGRLGSETNTVNTVSDTKSTVPTLSKKFNWWYVLLPAAIVILFVIYRKMKKK